MGKYKVIIRESGTKRCYFYNLNLRIANPKIIPKYRYKVVTFESGTIYWYRNGTIKKRKVYGV